MKRNRKFKLLIGCLAMLLASAFAVAQDAAKCVRSTSQPQSSSELERVLRQMDKAASAFRSTEADFVWNQYQKVVNDTDIQKGKIYFRRQDKEIQMAADITEPDHKYVLFSNGTVRVYQPRIDQVTEYNAGKNRADLESFLVLGFGGSGHDLLKLYDVKSIGKDKVDGVETDTLALVPMSIKVRNSVASILIWFYRFAGATVQKQFLGAKA